MRNRLEQLRKRQRDEALQAQEELLAGVAKSAARGDRQNVMPEVDGSGQEAVPPEEVEPYDRSMSPALLDIRKLPYEERQIDIVTEIEELRSLVSNYCGLIEIVVLTNERFPPSRCNNEGALQPLDSYRKRSKLQQRPKRQKHQATLILPRPSIARKPKGSLMRRKNYSTSRRISLIPRVTTGKTNGVRVSPGTSIVYTRVMNGTSTTKHTTSM